MANFIVSATPTVDTNIYASGDLIGTKLSFQSSLFKAPTTAVLEAVELIDQSKNSANIDVVLFGVDPSATTLTDNAALDVADADMSKIVGTISLSNHVAFADNGVSTREGIRIPISLVSDTLYAILVSRATPTFAAATDVTLKLHFT